MTTTAQVTARTAAQLREAARDVALVAERRKRRVPQPETATGSSTPTRACDYEDETMADMHLPGEYQPDGEPKAAMTRVITRALIHAMAHADLASDSKVIHLRREPT